MPAPKPDMQDEVAVAEAAVVGGLGHRERDRRRGGVAVLVDVDDRLLARDAEAGRSGFDDAGVRLVGDEPVDVVGRQSGPGEGDAGGLHDGAHGAAEHLLALHLDVLQALLDRVGSGGQAAAAGRDAEQVGRGAVAAEVEGEEARSVVG